MHRSRALRPLLPSLITGCLLLLPAGALGDEGAPRGWERRHALELGLYGGAYFPPKSHELFSLDYQHHPFDRVSFIGGLRLGYYPLRYLGVELEGGVMPTEIRDTDLGALIYHFRGQLVGQYPWRLTPFVVVGYGLLGVSSAPEAVGNDVDGSFHTGLGAKVYITDRLTARLEGRLDVSGQRGRGGYQPHFEALAGLSYMLWYKRPGPPPAADRDGDGVPDDRDRCPGVAARTADGCPADRDGDGVPDAKDRCPGVAARTADGCPADRDGDGVPDARDRCPDKPETKNGHQDDDGCPDQLPVVKRFSGKLPMVHFRLESAVILPRYRKRLDGVVKVLGEYPDLRLLLRGHADETGPEDFNMRLSRRRAEGVKRYLVRRGVAAGRLQTEALGESEPLVTGQTPEAWAKNRRVELRVQAGGSRGTGP
jgi:OOP family OmpA-OmpF porin